MGKDLISQEALERIIKRAAELQAGEHDVGDGLTSNEVLALGKDVGIPDRYLRQAMLEEQTRITPDVATGTWAWLTGPRSIVAHRVVPGDRATVERALTRWMTEAAHQTHLRRQRAGGARVGPHGGNRAHCSAARTRAAPDARPRRWSDDRRRHDRPHVSRSQRAHADRPGAGARPARARRHPVVLQPGRPARRAGLRTHRRRSAQSPRESPAETEKLRSAMADVKRVGVLGCGLMGSGIAQVAATAGYETIVRDVSKDILDRGRAGIEKSLAKFVEKGKLQAADRDEILRRVTFTTAVPDLRKSDIIIEAITEDLALKNMLFLELDGLCGAGTIFASNTSSLTIAEMAAATKRADRFVGLHFFNPVPLMALVEVVRTVTTSEQTFTQAFAFAASLRKEPVAAKDNSGFIVNLLLVPYLLDAIRAVERGVGSVTDIDKAMQLGCGYPMGPLTLLDFVGLDTTHHIAEIMFTEYRETRYAPPPLLKRMVLAGMYGKKSGKGFYDYSATPPIVNNLGL